MAASDERTRRLLVIGTSSSFGVGLANPTAEAWPWLIRDALQERYGEIDCVVRMFTPDAPNAGPYLEQQLERYPADWVVLQCTAAGLTLRTVPYRVANILGVRAGRLAQRLVRNADGVVGAGGGTPTRTSRSLRWLARRVIGVDTRTRYRPLVDGYLRAIGRLARLETAVTAVIGTGHPHSAVARDNAKCPEMVERFNAEIAASARLRRIPWVDHDMGCERTANEHDATFVDRLHKNDAWHQQMAEHVLAVIDGSPWLRGTVGSAPVANSGQV